MQITEETVKHVARLARLELTEDEVRQYSDELSKILGHISQLEKLDLSSVSQEAQTELLAPVLREDVAQRLFTREELLKNAPVEEDGFFQVPQILSSSK